jgi:hypothetical protein
MASTNCERRAADEWHLSGRAGRDGVTRPKTRFVELDT